MNVPAPPDTYYASHLAGLSGAYVAAQPVITTAARVGLASPLTGNATNGAQAILEVTNSSLEPIADADLVWDPDGHLTIGLPLGHVFLFTYTTFDASAADVTFYRYDPSNGVVSSADLTAFGDKLIAMIIDYAHGSVDYALDGVTLSSGEPFNPTSLNERGYALLGDGQFGPNAPRVIFDDVSISAIAMPEPMLLCGGLLFPVARRRCGAPDACLTL